MTYANFQRIRIVTLSVLVILGLELGDVAYSPIALGAVEATAPRDLTSEEIRAVKELDLDQEIQNTQELQRRLGRFIELNLDFQTLSTEVSVTYNALIAGIVEYDAICQTIGVTAKEKPNRTRFEWVYDDALKACKDGEEELKSIAQYYAVELDKIVKDAEDAAHATIIAGKSREAAEKRQAVLERAKRFRQLTTQRIDVVGKNMDALKPKTGNR